jgi:hypothetical protein
MWQNSSIHISVSKRIGLVRLIFLYLFLLSVGCVYNTTKNFCILSSFNVLFIYLWHWIELEHELNQISREDYYVKKTKKESKRKISLA